MKKISISIFKIILILIMLQVVLTTTSHAGFWGNVIDTGDQFLEDGSSQDSPIDSGKLEDEIGKLYNMLLTAGVVVAVLAGAILGIKFITGSLDEQAKIKEVLIPYVVGCIVIFGAFGIWKLVMETLSAIGK